LGEAAAGAGGLKNATHRAPSWSYGIDIKS